MTSRVVAPAVLAVAFAVEAMRLHLPMLLLVVALLGGSAVVEWRCDRRGRAS